ncbi:hypothetical protein ES703_116323 [subsurface metagenome]
MVLNQRREEFKAPALVYHDALLVAVFQVGAVLPPSFFHRTRRPAQDFAVELEVWRGLEAELLLYLFRELPEPVHVPTDYESVVAFRLLIKPAELNIHEPGDAEIPRVPPPGHRAQIVGLLEERLKLLGLQLRHANREGVVGYLLLDLISCVIGNVRELFKLWDHAL